jgi:hypothetical protein
MCYKSAAAKLISVTALKLSQLCAFTYIFTFNESAVCSNSHQAEHCQIVHLSNWHFLSNWVCGRLGGEKFVLVKVYVEITLDTFTI